MNAKITAVATVAIALASVSQARAQNTAGETIMTEKPLAAPQKALEIVVGTGYTQGFGSLQQGVDMANVATAGLGVDLGIGYRIDPHWAIGLVGQYQEFSPERAVTARGVTPGIAATFHAAPYSRTDPWVQLGVGYRFLWENNDPATPSLLTHGIEAAKLTFGLDLRADKGVAIAPYLGADIGVPLWQSVGNTKSVAIDNPTANLYVFAGLQARFDVTSNYASPKVAAPPPPPPPVEETQVTSVEITPPPPVEMKPVSPSINVSEEILARCNMHFDNVDKAPKFEFDKSDLLPADYDVLKQIADCLTSGPLQGENLNLVGRADPRGTKAYNEKLGMRRANTVAIHLEQLGVASTRMERASRGELDAIGTDEASWAIDRRVDISLRH